MQVILTLLFVLSASWLSFAMNAQANALYLCDDGKTTLLTDKASLGCPVYEPQADLLRVPDGATWADVQSAVATQHPEAFQPPTQSAQIVPQIAHDESARSDFCRQWIDLNLETDGGLDMDTDENTRKFLALSRIVTATNLCEGYMSQEGY